MGTGHMSQQPPCQNFYALFGSITWADVVLQGLTVHACRSCGKDLVIRRVLSTEERTELERYWSPLWTSQAHHDAWCPGCYVWVFPHYWETDSTLPSVLVRPYDDWVDPFYAGPNLYAGEA